MVAYYNKSFWKSEALTIKLLLCIPIKEHDIMIYLGVVNQRCLLSQSSSIIRWGRGMFFMSEICKWNSYLCIIEACFIKLFYTSIINWRVRNYPSHCAFDFDLGKWWEYIGSASFLIDLTKFLRFHSHHITCLIHSWCSGSPCNASNSGQGAGLF